MKFTIDTLSYKEGAKPVHWVSDGGTEYEMADGDKDRCWYRDHTVS